MDFDNEVAEGITHLDGDISPNLFHKVDFSSLAHCFRNRLPFLATVTCVSAIMMVTKTLVSVWQRQLDC